MRRFGAIFAWVLAGLVMAGAAAWGALALFYLGPGSEQVRTVVAGSFGAIGLAAIVALAFRRTRLLGLVGLAALFAVALTVWARATPSNHRDWQPEVAVLPYATFDGNLVTVHNIRNFDYRTETNFTPGYYDRKDRTKPYATLPGFFRQYELVYIVADERDVIRVRTN